MGERQRSKRERLKDDTRWPALGDLFKRLSIAGLPDGFNKLVKQKRENKKCEIFHC